MWAKNMASNRMFHQLRYALLTSLQFCGISFLWPEKKGVPSGVSPAIFDYSSGKGGLGVCRQR